MSDENKKELAIVMGATGNMAFAVANVLIGLKKHSGNLKSDIIIYEQGVSETDKSILKSILPCNFIYYSLPFKEDFYKNKTFKQFTALTYSRFECFELLKKYKKVIWLDIDILIQDDVRKIIPECKTSIGMSQDVKKLSDNFYNLINGYNYNINYYNAGVIVLKDSLDKYGELKDWCYAFAQKNYYDIKYHDQAVLNLMIQEFNLDITNLDCQKYNCYPLDKKVRDAIIVHPAGKEKFWNFWNFSEWNKNYKQWIKMGGSKYTGKKINLITKGIRKFLPYCPDPTRQTRDFIKYLLEKRA